MINTLSKLLGNSPKTISNWKKDKRPIITLITKYLTKTEIEEFLENGQIEKLELIKHLSVDELKKKINNHDNIILEQNINTSLSSFHTASLRAFIVILQIDNDKNIIDNIDEIISSSSFSILGKNIYNIVPHNSDTYISKEHLKSLKRLLELYITNDNLEYIQKNKIKYVITMKEILDLKEGR